MSNILPQKPADALSFMFELITNKEAMPALAINTLKGVRSHNLKQEFIESINAIAQSGESKLSSFTRNEVHILYEEVADFIDQIDEGIDISKFDAIKRLISQTLTEEEKKRVYIRKLIQVVNELTSDDTLVLKALDEEIGVAEISQNDEDAFIDAIAKYTGLYGSIFVDKSIKHLQTLGLIKNNYTMSASVTTQLGVDIAYFLKDKDVGTRAGS